jgi:hypothetical protein
VTLSWDAPNAASVGITRLSEEGDIFLATEARDLPVSGSIALQVPEEYLNRSSTISAPAMQRGCSTRPMSP